MKRTALNMPARKSCGRCATPIPVNAPQGLCPACLLTAGFTALGSTAKRPATANARVIFEKSKARTTVGDYELIEEIARGGMGIVFRARQISLNRTVAVKALLFGEFASDPFIARFRDEAQAAAALQHPNIVAIHDVWQHAGQHFFSMEFVDGQTLAHIVKDGPLSARRAARYAQIVARAVHFAHERGIVHRDLKPSNVLIDSADQPRVTDFGLAKRLDHEGGAQPVSGVVGSPHYMSPEQAGQRGAAVGPGSDVYAIGAMLYHMLAGRPPFAGENIEEVLAQTIEAEPIRPRLLNVSVPRDLETICLKCLEKDPRRRYETALDLAEDLERFAQRIPIRARPIAPAERIVRWCRRNPAPAAVLFLLTATTILTTWASIHFRDLNQTIRIGQYLSDMNVAARHLEQSDNSHAITLLKAHVPRGNELDLRGFEWRHMWWLCRGNYDDWLPSHPQIVGAIHHSSDGKKIVTFAWDETIRVWDAQTRRNLLTVEKASAFGGFTSDEKAIVANRTDGSLQILDASGATNRSIPAVGQLVGFSRKTGTVATLNTNGILSVWNLQNNTRLLVISNAPPAKLNYSWNSPVIIAPDASKVALIVPNANPLLPSRAVRIFDLLTGVELDSLSENRELRCAAFSPDAKFLVTGEGQGKVRVWNIATHEFKDIFAHSMPVLSLAFAPDGSAFATGSSDQHPIRLWNLATATPLENDFRGQAGDVWSLNFSPDGQRLASGTRDGIVRIWTLARAKPLPQLDRLHAHEYANMAFSPDSKLFAGGCASGVVKIWNVATLETVAIIPRVNYVVAFSSDGRRLLVSDIAGDAFWWDIEKRTAERLPNYGGKLSEVVSVSVSPDRRIAALGLSDGAISLVDMAAGAPAAPMFKGHSAPVYSVAFSPDGQKLASGGGDMNVMMWDVRTGSNLGVCQEHKAAVYGLAISPDGKTLASGCGAETIKLWDVNNVAKHAWASASFHRAVIRSLSFSPDNRTLASGSEDRTVKLSNFVAFSNSTARREVASFSFDESLRGVLFSPDGNTLAAVTDHGTVRIFRAFSLRECDRQFRELR
jgi:WD40 repeat protein